MCIEAVFVIVLCCFNNILLFFSNRATFSIVITVVVLIQSDNEDVAQWNIRRNSKKNPLNF